MGLSNFNSYFFSCMSGEFYCIFLWVVYHFFDLKYELIILLSKNLRSNNLMMKNKSKRFNLYPCIYRKHKKYN